MDWAQRIYMSSWEFLAFLEFLEFYITFFVMQNRMKQQSVRKIIRLMNKAKPRALRECRSPPRQVQVIS